MEVLKFRISGRIYEAESNLGVQGLMVRAYDKDLIFDDLLGSAITDKDGHFELSYSEADFRELFETQPDIYLTIYALPACFLMDTEDAIRWNAGTNEEFDIAISRKVLGDHSPVRPDNQVETKLDLPRKALKIEKRGGFDVPHIPGFATTGIPGAPAVPQQMRYVALPQGGDVLKLEVIPGEVVRIEGEFKPLPAQEPVPDVGTDPETNGGFSIENVFYEMTPPHPKYFEGEARYPAQLAELVRVEAVGPIRMAAIKVRPVQYDAATNSYLFYPDLQYVVTFDREKAKRVAEERQKEQATIGELYAEQLEVLLENDLVSVASDIFWPGIIIVLEDAPHIIITDNYQWPENIQLPDGTTRPPTISERGAALNGDMVAEFQRLAQWRTSHGIKSRVVTISAIIEGTYGEYTQGGFARDLQEVIRNFIKSAHKNWDTLYVVLAGDVSVVPMRKLTGCGMYGTFGVSKTNDNPPPKRNNHFLAGLGVCKLQPEFIPSKSEPLSTYHGGVRVPYDRDAGPGRLGWYFTTESDFNSRNEGFVRLPDSQPTRFVIVEGPDTVIDDHYYWVRDVNSIPSDFYYASLVGSGYSVPGKHDFDDNNNGLYGQYHWDGSKEVTQDEVDFNSDVWVGRVPADNAAQAKAFVDKLITYESLRTPGSPSANVDASYLRKVLYAADYWGRPGQGRQNDTATPPGEGKFTHVAGATITKIHTAFDIGKFFGITSHRLVAHTGTNQVTIPYNSGASATSAGWFFTTSDTYANYSSSPTRFIKVVGPEAIINPTDFFWDPLGLELASKEKENLRGMMNGWFPKFNSVNRHYADYFDLSAPPPIVPLESASLRTALNQGQHFLSLTGHGWWGGCCGINANSQPDFTNAHQYFIAFADSCSTGRPDGVDSLGEISVIDAGGGAVAYIGNTRYSWIGVGDNYEQFFWCALKAFGKVGPAAGMRLATDGIRSIWTFYAQTLYGDPAMRIWKDVPFQIIVTHVPEFRERDVIPISVNLNDIPLRDARVTVTGGEGESAVFMSKKTGAEGRLSFSLPPEAGRLKNLHVTVTSRDGLTYQGTINHAGDALI